MEELVKRQIGGSTIWLTKLNICALKGYTEYIRFRNPYTAEDMLLPDLRVEEVYPFTLYITEYAPKRSTIYSTWVSTLNDGDNIVKLIKEHNSSEIGDLRRDIEQYLCAHEISYGDFKDLKVTTFLQ